MALLLPSLTEWQVFSQIVGSAAGALTGLQFVVMALIADMPMREGETSAEEAFATPTRPNLRLAGFVDVHSMRFPVFVCNASLPIGGVARTQSKHFWFFPPSYS